VGEGEDIEADLVAAGGGLSIRVLSSSGEPLFAEVFVAPLDEGPITERVREGWSRWTDESGEAVFHHLPSGPIEILAGYEIRVGRSQGNHVPGRTKAMVPEEGIEKVELRLLEGTSSLEVHILGPGGVPLPGAAFLLLDEDGLCVKGHWRSGMDGTFRIEGLRRGPYLACAAAKGHGPVRDQEILVGPGRNLAEICLTVGATLTVTVVDKVGRPIPGVALEFTDFRGQSVLDLTGYCAGLALQVTGESGRSRIEHIAPGRYTITASDGSREASLTVEVAEGEAAEVRIELE